MTDRAEPREKVNERVTHGRHCPCSACKREDWTRPELGPCGMHGEGCPAVYAPLPSAAGSSVPDTSGQPETVEGGHVNVPRGDDAARVIGGWDGTPTGRCDHTGCANPVVVHFELSTADEWAAECDLCEQHLPQIAEQARTFAVAVGAIAPSSESDRNVLAAVSEHLT